MLPQYMQHQHPANCGRHRRINQSIKQRSSSSGSTCIQGHQVNFSVCSRSAWPSVYLCRCHHSITLFVRSISIPIYPNEQLYSKPQSGSESSIRSAKRSNERNGSKLIDDTGGVIGPNESSTVLQVQSSKSGVRGRLVKLPSQNVSDAPAVLMTEQGGEAGKSSRLGLKAGAVAESL